MCGIFGGSVQLNNVDKCQVMQSQLKHRGPDDDGMTVLPITSSRKVVMGHTRLSILDLSIHGHQPMSFDNLTLVYNGECYNYKELRESLKTNYTFESHTDTEVVLKGIHAEGLSFVHRMIGMFAFAIYDKKRQVITLVRDRLGVKPLYYARLSGEFVFASEFKALQSYCRATGYKLGLDNKAVFSYFSKGYIGQEMSICSPITKLLPGHYLEFSVSTQESSQLTIRSYWQLDQYTKKQSISYEEAKSQLKSLLISAVEYRMISDVSVGVYLSGGVDSNLVAALLRKECGYDIDTFSIGFDHSKYNEASISKRCAAYLGTNHHETYLNAQSLEKFLPIFHEVYDEPFADSSAIPMLALAEFSKQYVGVVLSADGGDELLGGYSIYQNAPMQWKKLNLIRPFKLLLTLMRYCYLPRRLQRKCAVAQALLEHETFSKFFAAKQGFMYDFEIKKLLGLSGTSQANSDRFQDATQLNKMLLDSVSCYLPDDILFKVDRASMAYGLEAREPLLDHRLFEFCASLPDEYKIYNGKGKRLMRDVLSEYLPLDYLVQKKAGFTPPIKSWLMSIPAFDMSEKLTEWIDVEFLNQIKLSARADNVMANYLWMIKVFDGWLQQYDPKK